MGNWVREQRKAFPTHLLPLQALRTRSEGFFLVLALPLTKYVTLENSMSVGSGSSSLHLSREDIELNGPWRWDWQFSSFRPSFYSQEVRAQITQLVRDRAGLELFLKSGASLPTRHLHSLHTWSPAVLSIGAVREGSLDAMTGEKASPQEGFLHGITSRCKGRTSLPLSQGSPTELRKSQIPPCEWLKTTRSSVLFELLTIEWYLHIT